MKKVYGGGLPVFIAGQREGVEGIFNVLARMIIPVYNRTRKTVLKKGLRSDVYVLGNTVSGQNVKSSLRELQPRFSLYLKGT